MSISTYSIASLFALSMSVASTAYAADKTDSFPVRPIRLVVPYPAGGPADTLARFLAPGATAHLGQQVVVDNRGGAGGSIAVDTVVRSQADGYTLLFGNDGPVAVVPSLYKKVSYDPVRDLSAITQLTSSQLILVAHPSVPFKTMKDLLARARAHPGEINFASSGSGNASHLAGELLKTSTGIEIVHIPYKGSGPALIDVISGRVHMLFNNLLSALPHVKSGKLIALATTGRKRTSATPDVPTVMEAGVQNYEVALWAGILAPAGTPTPTIGKLHKALVATIQLPEVSSKLIAQGVEVVASTPEQFSHHIKSEVEKWAQVVRASGAKVD